MNTPKMLLCGICAMWLASGCHMVAGDPVFRMTLKVVDDEGRPVEGALARIGAERRSKPGESEGKGVFASGLTDASGLFTGEVAAWNATQSGYRVEKDRHYGVWESYSATSVVSGRWQPWNPTVEVVLKRIRNPVPMYAKRVQAEIPVKGEPVGYDLAMGDWVEPHGKGRHPDMVLRAEGEWNDRRNYRGLLTVHFPGEGNGLVPHEIDERDPSPLKMPYEAPAEGYLPERVWRSVRKYNRETMRNDEYVNDSNKTTAFFIRVRTEKDSEGRIVRAWYGKTQAPFEFGLRGPDGTPVVIFTYCLNPDDRRNVEYDPKRNLLKSPKRHDSDYENIAP